MKLPKTIEHVSVETLIPYARNSRTHSDAQVAQIAASIKEFGFTNPVLIDLGLKPEPDDEGLYTETQVQRMIELLERCENEMRYAGWTKYEADNSARNGVYEQIKQFLENPQ